MATISPYIHFNGNALEAFTFYKSVFGGEFSALSRYKDTDFLDEATKAAEGEKIMHIELPIGTAVLMGSDTPSAMGTHNERENRTKLSVQASSREEADRIYRALSAGGEIEMPIGESPWGSYFAMFRDKYGFEWMINFDPKASV